MFRKPVKAAAVAHMLSALLLLSACANQPASAPGSETEQLRVRVERLEREAAAERDRLATDIAALRQDLRALRLSMEEASRSLAAAAGSEGEARPGVSEDSGRAGKPGQPEKSPRQALRDSLRNVLEVTRAALERLSLELDRQLAQPQKPEAPAR
jgi:hypothetical protein